MHTGAEWSPEMTTLRQIEESTAEITSVTRTVPLSIGIMCRCNLLVRCVSTCTGFDGNQSVGLLVVSGPLS